MTVNIKGSIEKIGILISDSNGANHKIPDWALHLLELGSLVIDDRAQQRASLIILVLPTRRLAGPLIAAGVSVAVAARASDALQFEDGDEVYWVDGEIIRRGVFRGYWTDPGLGRMPKIEQRARGDGTMIGKSGWQLFPGRPVGHRENLEMFTAVEPFRKRCEGLASPRQEATPRNILLASRDAIFADADSVTVKVADGRATLRQLLLWDQGGGIGHSVVFAANSRNLPDYGRLETAILDGPESIHHLERDHTGDKLMTANSSCIVLLDELEFRQCESQLQGICDDWAGLPAEKGSVFEGVYKNLHGAGIWHHIRFEA
jgi:hypothetical protein